MRAVQSSGKSVVRASLLAALLAVLALLPAVQGCRKGAQTAGDPYDLPAQVTVEGNEVVVAYRGERVFAGRVEASAGPFTVTSNVFRNGSSITNVLAVTAASGGGRAVLSGSIAASGQSFPCQADRPDKGPVVVRHVSGLSRSRLNRAVYDRAADWLLSVDAGPAVAVGFEEEEGGQRSYGMEAEGREIVLRFRPAYYRVHRGLEFFEPWTYDTWTSSVAGWISWFAFYDKINEADVVETADTLAETLKPFGYDLLQIDDGYQRGEGRPDLWLEANEKFPRGLEFLPGYIKDKGLTPGIWTNAAFKQADFVESHRDWFVTDEKGRPAWGNWVGYSLDASNGRALDEVVRPVYRGLKGMGWEYFKVDALRHLRYEGYNAHAGHFARRKAGLTASFRRYVEAIREEVGREPFILGCWGIRPELVGLIDGCRIGTDGFSYAGLAQFNSWNNVVWRNDPDHIELDDERYRSLLVTSLTGSILLLTDKPAVYRTEAVEAARRAAPVLGTVPGQVFDVDPSRSNRLDRVGEEVSGSGPRPFDAGMSPACDLWLLELVRPFDSWMVLGRTGESQPEIRFADLGLDPDKEYAVFEFWSKRASGSFSGGFAPGRPDPVFRSQCFIIRERRPHPQLLATSRHLTGGGPDLLDMTWAGGRLSGRSLLVGGDPYDLYVNVPDGYRLSGVEVDGADEAGVQGDGTVRRIRLSSATGGEAAWTLAFTR